MFLHSWTVFEDIIICKYAMAGKDDPKTIKKLSVFLGISENRIAFRMADFSKLAMGKYKDWHFSKQERKVFDWMSAGNTSRMIKFTPLI